LTEEQKQTVGLLEEYISAYSAWAGVVNELTEPEKGLNAQWEQAAGRLSELNLNILQVTDVLDMPETSLSRKEYLEEFKKNFPNRVEKIDAVIAAYDGYRVVGGRLDDPEDLKRMLKGAGVLEFRVLPTTGDGKSNANELQGYVEALNTKGPKLASDNRYIWCEIETPQEFPQGYQDIGELKIGKFGEKFYVLASNQVNEKMLHEGPKPWKLQRAYPTQDQMGRRVIGFTNDPIGSSIFYNVTRNNVGRPLCILLDGLALSAPTIDEAIRDSGIIRGEFTPTEVEDMVNKLNAGSFPARLSEVPISEKSIGATIGADNRDQGIKAGLIGMAAVAVFMIIYYLFCGSIADIALLMNILFVLGMMAFSHATFTLPGIAGLILTIGMSVDANVLIFERIREEQEAGSSLRTAIANGYKRAFRTIFDANITTFITALILYMVASEEIKGFAIVLMLGIISSMFTSLFVTRVIFDYLVGRRIIRDHLVMLRLIRKPNVNWMGIKGMFFLFSILLIAGGMLVFFNRDDIENSKYDIEFTGGTSVQIDLKADASHTRSYVEQTIREKGRQISNDALAAAKVYSVGDTGYQDEISTTATNKTTATVNFPESGTETIESVTGAIQKQLDELSATLANLSVTSEDGKTFEVATSQVNKGMVKDILERAFGQKANVSTPVVNEVVNQAIRDAFEGRLELREDLGIKITETKEITDVSLELADFLGGIQVTCALEKETTAGELETRFQAILFKPDMQDLARYRYKILRSDLSEFDAQESVTNFVYVSVHPESGYREFDENEWNRFVENEQSKITQAASLKTSLARVTQIDPSIGKQAKLQALLAIILSLIAIVGYIWIRFGTARYGFAAIAALVHDVCITLGAVTVCTYIAGTTIGDLLLIGDFKINLEMIAAFLTIIGYSLNDTIVVFDRIRENRGKQANLNPQLISKSINQTLSRTLLTSLTTFMVVLVMYIWGGAGLRGFTFAMLIGILVGTYSSIAIAAPILILGQKNQSQQTRK
jgi:SecD/SecF fusion protein